MTETYALTPQTLSGFEDIVGAPNVITDPVELRYYSEDVYRSFETALAVVQPESAQQIGRIVSLCKANGLYIVPRGGMSYTDSYLHKTRRGISIDMRRMNRIININTRDMIVTVECGCTWQKLNEALAPHGLRPPYWGPLSGMRATIGGALSQNSRVLGGDSDFVEDVKILEKYRIDTGYLLCTVGNSAFLVEPVFFWPDELNEVHRRNVEPEVFNRFTPVPANPEARSEVGRLRDEVRNIFLKQGAVHFQIGKYYPYRDSRRAAAWTMLEHLKDLLDKDGVINPGQLGLTG